MPAILCKREAAVDGEDLAGDEVGAGGEKEDGLSDVFGCTVAAHGSFGGEARGLQGQPSPRFGCRGDRGIERHRIRSRLSEARMGHP